MKKIIIPIVFTVFFSLLSPQGFLLAQETTTTTDGGALKTDKDATEPKVTRKVEDRASTKLANPLEGGNIDSIPKLVETLLRIILTIGVPIIALAIIYAGFKFVTAQGNPEKLKEAKSTFVWVVVGAAILLSAYAIATGISATIADIRGNS